MRRGLLVLALGLLIAGRSLAATPDEELAKLTGTWFATAVTSDGKEWAPADVKKVFLIVKGADYTFGEGARVAKGTHKLDPSKSPKTIDATRTSGAEKGSTFKGIYELEGDTFKVCFASPGKDRPADFSAKEGSGRRLIVLKRSKKKG
jgi:uncharacterized protein (TIGR03067 family)